MIKKAPPLHFGSLPVSPLASSEQGTKILRAAIALFTREGWGSFTTRRVAKEACVSLGSLQHIFSSKDHLLAAMLQTRLSEYDGRHQSLFANLPFNGELRLLGAIELLVVDVFDPSTRSFFFNLFALSCSSPFAARLVNETYASHRRSLAALVGAARPQLTEAQCMNIGLQLGSALEGMMIYTAPGAKAFDGKDQAISLVKHLALSLMESNVPTATKIKKLSGSGSLRPSRGRKK